MKVTVHTDAVTASTDAPVESAEALQRSALEVRLPPPPPERMGELAELLVRLGWIRAQDAG